MATKTHRWSRADLASLPDDGNRYEVLDGKLFVTLLPSFPHQWIVAQLIRLLAAYVERHRLGSVVGSGAVVFGDSELQPDAVVFPVEPATATQKWDDLPPPTLVAEVLSPTTRRRDLNDKRAAYQDLRVPVYWVIDPPERRALVWEGDSTDLTIVEELHWRPRLSVEALVIRVVDILPKAEAERAGHT